MTTVVGVLAVAAPIAAVAGLAVLLVVVARRRARERHEGMTAYAAQREWRLHPSAPHLTGRFEGDPFGRGSRRSATNSLEGTYEGRHVVAFDYSYVTESDDSSSTHRFSVVAMHLGRPGLTVPRLQVSPQGSFGRFFSGLFGTDLLVGHPGFDDAFHVRTDSPELARDVLHPGMVELLGRLQDRAWRLQGDSLLMFRPGRHTPEEIDRVLGSMKAILDHVPPHVWARLEGHR
jgi:hypothetical protein